MGCAVCGQEGARIRRVTRSYGKGETLLLIENVPVVSCPHCGTSYLTTQTLHEIDRIKRHRHSPDRLFLRRRYQWRVARRSLRAFGIWLQFIF
jgi:YgiT-type zinc finger domain-containing protein